jgi:nitrogen regulatory protein P-II 1
MKEVKAFIRSGKAGEVIGDLENLGVADITLIDVMGIGEHLSDPNQAKYTIDVVRKYSQLAKVEIVCRDEDVHNIVETIRKTAFTGMRGDGMIYVMPVEMTVKIRTGSVGEEAL